MEAEAQSEIQESCKMQLFRRQWQVQNNLLRSKLNMSLNGYAKIERGESKIYLDKLEQIAQVFDIDVIWVNAIRW